MNKTNTGDYNTGDYNTGYRNTGDYNTGDYNTGDCNTGDGNTGYRNTGDYNTGYRNTGYCNTGYRNTGDHNTGDYNTGYCNSVAPEDCLIFNKPAKRKDWYGAEKPDWMFVNLTKWISESEMTKKEKDAYPSYVTTGGYLKAFATLQDAFKDSWDKADKEDRDKTFNLPNYDREVFIEVFGFDPEKDSRKKVILELTDEQIKRLKEQGIM
jgi:hypothetical protein